ncbi:LysR substrate-binding domain-containing protein [Rhizobium sp. 'Codium 1']|uniref:LysR substrate-binding domain-containing protein n=1 Tax=Rhizobium sp. 'Codium 1' TaxID=2940484 RepID=UPI001E64D3DC|nr:LysR substrate-binding domain-containing protein [Rhizobium sp. 'Codium 1']MCC8932240.1 LysR family transcriptional regulator [Rhizobium sp. 'Codium 1']
MKLPPLPTLRAFEAAARRESFLQAATELGMTAAAVSQHVKALEDWLGLALFERRTRGVRLTADGRELGAACSEGLGHIARAAERLTARRSGLRVSLACKPSVVNHWLGPRLPRFRATHPEIQVSVVYPLGALTPDEAGTDLLIRHGTRPPGGAERILEAATRPTCSPAYLDQHGPIITPADLLKQHLLHDATEAAWHAWLAARGVAGPTPTGPLYADFNLLVSSVLSGLGIGLCPTALIADQLAAGTLKVLFDAPADEDKAYWLLSGADLPEPAAVLRDWLLAERSDHSP